MQESMDTDAAQTENSIKQDEKAKLCPLCCTIIKPFRISDTEILSMCPSTKCSYPFYSKVPLDIRRTAAIKLEPGYKAADPVKEDVQAGQAGKKLQIDKQLDIEPFDMDKFLAENEGGDQYDMEAFAEIFDELLSTASNLINS